MKKNTSDSGSPNNQDPNLGFTNGIHLDGFDEHQTLTELLARKVSITKESNGGYKISSLLDALCRDLIDYESSPQFSVTEIGNDWEQLVFPTQEGLDNADLPYSRNFIVSDEESFQKVIEEHNRDYPKKTFDFALLFFWNKFSK